MFLDRFHTYAEDDVHLLTCNSIPKSAMLQVAAPATFVTEQLRIACTQIILADSTGLSPWKLKILQNYDENCLKDLERKFDFTADYIVRHLQLGSNCENKILCSF
jgi:hypothetical protein